MPAPRPQLVQPDPDDEGLRGHVGYNMKRAFHMIQMDVNATLAPFGLRMVTFSALVVVMENPGLRQSQLAELLAIERPNLVVILDELEQAGLLTRDRAPDDRRAYALHVTAKGLALCEEARIAVSAHDKRMAEGLTDAELDLLITALRRIERNGKLGRSPK
ncbi:MarR family transcriptional regulator [Vannielia litorea]|uniref:MarR family winged helix-turn-helix transcriptional regulator n=1 Tax=Vannielia TaxID=2813041 RepID=UPI001C971E9E|nr:MarR family transcriptional regulator [Vannielia litorea]MBY6049406.1 MarR family transcriptional regulator [Vannielia litorea]MBY6076820.1 MarR family transcriptional regulator [Vannielia litorea]MBY6155056.1 MarR family transcriptional regulator [Vannielia litorea]